MVHTFKAAVLRQSDWTRVAFTPDANTTSSFEEKMLNNKKMVERIANILLIPQVHQFNQKYQELMALRTEIRSRINKQQNELYFYKKPRKQDNSELLSLYALEKRIQFVAGFRELDKLLVEP